MPGLFTPSPHANGRNSLRANPFEPAPRYGLATETSGRQVTEGMGPHETWKPTRSTFSFTASAPRSFSATTSTSWSPAFNPSPFADAKNSPPLANDRYELASGMHTPIGGGSKRLHGDYDDYFHLEKQRGLWETPGAPYSGMQAHPQADSMQSSPNNTVLNQIFNIVGGVAGKLVQFCTVPFRGFSAGGGQAYTLEADGKVAAKLFHEPPPAPVPQQTPGYLPSEENYGVRSIDSIDHERPHAKRLRTGDTWVVVEKDGSSESRPSSPRVTERRVPTHSRSPSQIPRPVYGTKTATPNHKRQSLIPVSRRSTLDKKSIQAIGNSPDPQPYANSRAYSRQNYSSPVMFETTATNVRVPLPTESHRLINKVRREEFEDNQRMSKMNQRMNAMLREAREALGSTIDVGDDDYMDDDV